MPKMQKGTLRLFRAMNEDVQKNGPIGPETYKRVGIILDVSRFFLYVLKTLFFRNSRSEFVIHGLRFTP